MKFVRVLRGFILALFFCLTLVGCSDDAVQDITAHYLQSDLLRKGYQLGSTYILQRDLFVTVGGGWPDAAFTKPGDGVPTVDEWKKGVRKPQFIKIVTLLPAGTKLRVEKIIFLKASGDGVSHATGMLQTDGFNLLINPSLVSKFLSVSPYGTLCLPDEKFLREAKSSAPTASLK
jgi:hypothetical protein